MSSIMKSAVATFLICLLAPHVEGNKGCGPTSRECVDLQDQDIVIVDKATGDSEGPNQLGFNRVVVGRIGRGVNGDDGVGVDNATDETDAFRGEVMVDHEHNMDNATDIEQKQRHFTVNAHVDKTRATEPPVVNPHGQVLVRVDKATANTLKSRLTTVFLPILYIIVFVVGLPANTMSLYVYLFRTTEEYAARIYMANLALSDVLFVIWIPLKIGYHFNGNDWIYGEGLCKVLVGFFYGNMYCSILFIASLSVYRCHLVAYPFTDKRRDSKVAIGVCVCIWVFIWTTTIPLYQYDHTVRIIDLNITTCHDVSGIWDLKDPFASIMYPYYYFMIMATVVCLIPCIVIVVAYAFVLCYLKKNLIHNASTAAAKTIHKTLVVMVIILVTFLVCFIPSNIMLVNHYYLLSIGEMNNGYGFYITSLCLASLNICLDPFLYYLMADDFKKHTKNILLCRSTRTAERMQYLETCTAGRTKT